MYNFILNLLFLILFKAYLIAIAVGKMESRQIGPISKVWTEVGLGDKAAYDFSDTADMMEKYTKLCGDYVWGQYDLVVLPPAYFMGGMENPGINFLTPTLLVKLSINLVA